MIIFLMALQALGSAPPEKVDLTIPKPCGEQRESDEVVVCGSRDGASPYRLKIPMQQSEQALPSARFQISEGVGAAVETEEADVGGFKSNRAMVRVKIKF